MNVPLPKRDKKEKKGSQDNTPTSTLLKDLSKKRKSSEKTKVALSTKSPVNVTATKVEIGQNQEEDSDREEKTDEHLLEIQVDQKKDDETEFSTYSELSESTTGSNQRKAKVLASPTIKQTIVQANMVPEVYLKDLTYSNIKAFQTYVELKKSLNQPFDLSKLIREDVKKTISDYFAMYEIANAAKWLTWSHELLFEQLINLSGGEANVTSIQEKLDNAKAKVLKLGRGFAFHPLKPAASLAYTQSLVEIVRVCEIDKMSEAENKALVEIAIKNLAMQSDARFKDVVSEIRAELNSFKSRILNLDQFRTEFIRIQALISKACQETEKYKLP
jgi:hypothetical protein